MLLSLRQSARSPKHVVEGMGTHHWARANVHHTHTHTQGLLSRRHNDEARARIVGTHVKALSHHKAMSAVGGEP